MGIRRLILIAAIVASGWGGGDLEEAAPPPRPPTQADRPKVWGLPVAGGGTTPQVPKAEPPPPAHFFAAVDLIVVNRVREFTTTYDAWGRPSHRAKETWWISFWQKPRGVVIAAHLPLIDRGWWTMSQVRRLTSCTGGWLAESKDGLNVIAKSCIFIDSPYDWEMKNRRMYLPIKKP